MSGTERYQPVPRGECPRCGFSVRIRKNGYAQRHVLHVGSEKWACPGGELMRAEGDEPRLPVAHWLERPHWQFQTEYDGFIA